MSSVCGFPKADIRCRLLEKGQRAQIEKRARRVERASTTTVQVAEMADSIRPLAVITLNWIGSV